MRRGQKVAQRSPWKQSGNTSMLTIAGEHQRPIWRGRVKQPAMGMTSIGAAGPQRAETIPAIVPTIDMPTELIARVEVHKSNGSEALC